MFIVEFVEKCVNVDKVSATVLVKLFVLLYVKLQQLVGWLTASEGNFPTKEPRTFGENR